MTIRRSARRTPLQRQCEMPLQRRLCDFCKNLGKRRNAELSQLPPGRLQLPSFPLGLTAAKGVRQNTGCS